MWSPFVESPGTRPAPLRVLRAFYPPNTGQNDA